MDRSVQTFGLRRGGGGGISEMVIPLVSLLCAVGSPSGVRAPSEATRNHILGFYYYCYIHISLSEV